MERGNIKRSSKIVKVTEEKREVLRQIATLGLVPGATVEMEEREPSRGPVIVKVMESSHALDHDIASIIWVKKVSGGE